MHPRLFGGGVGAEQPSRAIRTERLRLFSFVGKRRIGGRIWNNVTLLVKELIKPRVGCVFFFKKKTIILTCKELKAYSP